MEQQFAGAIAGIIGGMTIAAVGMIYRAAIGGGFLSLPNGIGGVVLGGDRGATAAFGIPTFTGVGLHMILSAIYGVLIVELAPRLGLSLVGFGTLFGVLVWLFNYYVVGAFHEGSRRLAQLNPVWMALFLHALFGAVTGIATEALLA